MDNVNLPEKFFITGTDTHVGKTVVSAILMAGLGAAYWKPIQSGLTETTDKDWIQKTTGLPDARFYPETYRLTQPLSPHAAAEADGICIHLKAFSLPVCGPLIVEGAGGVMVPINGYQLMTDLIKHLNLPVLLVARSTVGTINHALLSLSQLRHEGIDILGVVMNGPKNEINRQSIEMFGRIRVIAEIEPIMDMDAHSLQEVYDRHFSSGSRASERFKSRNPKKTNAG
jgi:dethiobiotin synthase